MSNQSIELRKPNPIDIADEDYGMIIRQLQNANQTCWIWDLLIKQEAPDATAEIRVAFTADFNGETTPIELFIITTVASEDKAAGTGAQKVTLFGIDEDGNPASEEVTLHAAAGTEITSLTKWKRFDGGLVTAAGAGGVNANTILITDTGQGNTYGTIALGENCTINARIYVPEGYSAFVGVLKAMPLIASHATAEVVYGDGVIVEPLYLKGTVTRLKIDEYWVGTDIAEFKNLDVTKELVLGADTYYISLKHVTKADDANRTVIYNLKIIMYKQNIGG